MSKNIPFVPTSTTYRPIGQYLLQRDYLEKGELPSYCRDIAVKAEIMTKRGTASMLTVEPEKLLIPTLDIASHMMVKDNEQNDCDYDIHERMEQRGPDSINRLVDCEIFKVINCAVPTDHTIEVEEFTINSLIDAITSIQDHDLPVGHIVMKMGHFNRMCEWRHPDFVNASNRSWREKQTEGNKLKDIYGYFKEIPILVSSMLPKNLILVLAEPEYVGVCHFRGEISKEQLRDAGKLRSGFLFNQPIGFGVINDYATAKVVTKKYLMTSKPVSIPVVNKEDLVFLPASTLNTSDIKFDIKPDTDVVSKWQKFKEWFKRIDYYESTMPVMS